MNGTYTCREITVSTVREEPFRSGRKNLADSPEKILDLWRTIIARSAWYHSDKEHLVCLCLDMRLRLKSFSLISMGSLSETVAHPREIFRPAIADSAYSIIVAHNHPSGDAQPSMIDADLTRRLYWAGELLQIPLEDHIVVGDGDYFSFHESSRFWPPRPTDLKRILSRPFPRQSHRPKSGKRKR